jgi:hypothetical protein
VPCQRCAELESQLAAARDEARKWEWVARHQWKTPLGEMNPGEPGSYVVQVDRWIDELVTEYLARYQPATNHRHSPDPLVNHGYNDICSCGVRIHRDGDAWVPDQPADEEKP